MNGIIFKYENIPFNKHTISKSQLISIPSTKHFQVHGMNARIPYLVDAEMMIFFSLMTISGTPSTPFYWGTPNTDNTPTSIWEKTGDEMLYRILLLLLLIPLVSTDGAKRALSMGYFPYPNRTGWKTNANWNSLQALGALGRSTGKIRESAPDG